MKIVHLCLASFYPEHHSYQENLLPKFHKKIGYDVEVIASTQDFDTHGNAVYSSTIGTYYNEYNIRVTRLAYLYSNSVFKKIKKYTHLANVLARSKPDILFIHGCQFLDIFTIVHYLKKHPGVKVYVDNHADFSNSARHWLSKNILHKILWRICAHAIEPYTTKFYGTLPARVEFLKDVYKLPAAKCELLVMGADDEMVEKATKPEVRAKIRAQYGIAPDDFLIVTGGKINHHRPETLHLMQAAKRITTFPLKLLIFGAVSSELQTTFNAYCDNQKILFVGWQRGLQTQQIMAGADLLVFPGLHSVMWEQAVALGVPCLFKQIAGFGHVDVGGNALFLKDVSVTGISEALLKILSDPTQYAHMKKIAQEKGLQIFSYHQIAKRSIEA